MNKSSAYVVQLQSLQTSYFSLLWCRMYMLLYLFFFFLISNNKGFQSFVLQCAKLMHECQYVTAFASLLMV